MLQERSFATINELIYNNHNSILNFSRVVEIFSRLIKLSTIKDMD